MRTAIYRGTARSTIERVPPRLTSPETSFWLDKAKKGDDIEKTTAVERLILGHIGLAGAIAARYAAKVPHKGEEIIAFALYMLVDATNRIATGDLMTQHDNYDAYISVVLSREIARFLNQDYAIRPPTNDPKVLEDEIRKDPEEFKNRYTPKPLSASHAVSPAIDRSLDFIIRDLVMESQCFASRERQIILLRLEGYDDVEIAAKLRISKQAVSQIRQKLRGRLERLTGEKS